MMGKKNETFEITDLPLLAFLRLQGFVIENIKRDKPRVVFILQDQPRRECLVRDFFNNKVSVSPLEYWNSLKDVKAMLFGQGEL